MSSAKVAAACVLAAVSLAACGSTAKPVAGTPQAATKAKHHVYNPGRVHIKCLRHKHIPVRSETLDGLPSFQVGTRPSGPTVEFMATPGAAQNEQIQGRAQGAEVIGAALVYPNQASDALLSKVETCVAKGVSG